MFSVGVLNYIINIEKQTVWNSLICTLNALIHDTILLRSHEGQITKTFFLIQSLLLLSYLGKRNIFYYQNIYFVNPKNGGQP